jgi:hypothetical protein
MALPKSKSSRSAGQGIGVGSEDLIFWGGENRALARLGIFVGIGGNALKKEGEFAIGDKNRVLPQACEPNHARHP